VVIKSSIFWDITPRSPLKVNRRFGGTCRPIFTALKMEVPRSSETSVDFQRSTRRYIRDNRTLKVTVLCILYWLLILFPVSVYVPFTTLNAYLHLPVNRQDIYEGPTTSVSVYTLAFVLASCFNKLKYKCNTTYKKCQLFRIQHADWIRNVTVAVEGMSLGKFF
jgi:hypothetical protein